MITKKQPAKDFGRGEVVFILRKMVPCGGGTVDVLQVAMHDVTLFDVVVVIMTIATDDPKDFDLQRTCRSDKRQREAGYECGHDGLRSTMNLGVYRYQHV